MADKKVLMFKPLVKANPCRPGTFCYAQVDAALNSKTVEEAQKKLNRSKLNPNKRRIEVGWMQRNKIVKVVKKAA